MTNISAIEYVLGEKKHLSSLKKDEVSHRTLINLASKGVLFFHESNKSIFDMAYETSLKTITKSGINPDEIDTLLFLTNSHQSKEFNYENSDEDTYFFGHELIRKLYLKNAFVQGLFMQGCVDFISGLIYAKSLIESNISKQILLVISDKYTCSGNNRLSIRNKVASGIHSDGASSCIISNSLYKDSIQINKGKIIHDISSKDIFIEKYLEKVFYAVLELNKMKPKDIEYCFSNNYNHFDRLNIIETLNLKKDIIGNENITQIGHCLGSDILINISLYLEKYSSIPLNSFLYGTSGVTYGGLILNKEPSIDDIIIASLS
ncbi:MAG TPA: hypothetical protein EYG89_05710 [Bacteroidia bacterium]|nr:hypothetical protein [Bacteroidia bacterium]